MRCFTLLPAGACTMTRHWEWELRMVYPSEARVSAARWRQLITQLRSDPAWRIGEYRHVMQARPKGALCRYQWYQNAQEWRREEIYYKRRQSVQWIPTPCPVPRLCAVGSWEYVQCPDVTNAEGATSTSQSQWPAVLSEREFRDPRRWPFVRFWRNKCEWSFWHRDMPWMLLMSEVRGHTQLDAVPHQPCAYEIEFEYVPRVSRSLRGSAAPDLEGHLDPDPETLSKANPEHDPVPEPDLVPDPDLVPEHDPDLSPEQYADPSMPQAVQLSSSAPFVVDALQVLGPWMQFIHNTLIDDYLLYLPATHGTAYERHRLGSV